MTIRACAILALTAALAGPGSSWAQLPGRGGSGGGGRSIRPAPERPDTASPNAEAEQLRAQANQFRLKGYDMIKKADDLRDNNKDDAGDELDQRAEDLFERARTLERRATQIELSGGQHPERVMIPDL